MLKTLGAKHRSSVTKMAARHQAKVATDDGPRTCFEARLKREGKKDLVARFGGSILRQHPRAGNTPPPPPPFLPPPQGPHHPPPPPRRRLPQPGTLPTTPPVPRPTQTRV